MGCSRLRGTFAPEFEFADSASKRIAADSRGELSSISSQLGALDATEAVTCTLDDWVIRATLAGGGHEATAASEALSVAEQVEANTGGVARTDGGSTRLTETPPAADACRTTMSSDCSIERTEQALLPLELTEVGCTKERAEAVGRCAGGERSNGTTERVVRGEADEADELCGCGTGFRTATEENERDAVERAIEVLSVESGANGLISASREFNAFASGDKGTLVLFELVLFTFSLMQLKLKVFSSIAL